MSASADSSSWSSTGAVIFLRLAGNGNFLFAHVLQHHLPQNPHCIQSGAADPQTWQSVVGSSFNFSTSDGCSILKIWSLTRNLNSFDPTKTVFLF